MVTKSQLNQLNTFTEIVCYFFFFLTLATCIIATTSTKVSFQYLDIQNLNIDFQYPFDQVNNKFEEAHCNTEAVSNEFDLVYVSNKVLSIC